MIKWSTHLRVVTKLQRLKGLIIHWGEKNVNNLDEAAYGFRMSIMNISLIYENCLSVLLTIVIMLIFRIAGDPHEDSIWYSNHFFTAAGKMQSSYDSVQVGDSWCTILGFWVSTWASYASGSVPAIPLSYIQRNPGAQISILFLTLPP